MDADGSPPQSKDVGNTADGVLIGGRYRLGKLLGEGRTGRIHQARDSVSGDRVAVKLLHAPLGRVADEVRRFAREFEVLQRIDHPNVVRGLSFGMQDDGPMKGARYLVMEMLDGKRLGEVLQSGALGADRAVRIAMDVSLALQSAHAHGVIHRDIEPDNIVITRMKGREVARVLDFGIARLQGNDEVVTEVGIRLGTPEYMCPEYVNDGEIDARSDLYAVGVLLYEMVTGAPPFVGKTLKVMQDHAESPVPPPSSRVAGLAPALEGLILQLLDKDPAQRPQTATSVIAALEAQLPDLDAEATQGRRALESLPPAPMTAPPASVGHFSEQVGPVYPDPKPLPKVPLVLALVLMFFGMLGVGGILGILLVLAVL